MPIASNQNALTREQEVRKAVVDLAKQKLDALIPPDPSATGRAKEWQDERERCIRSLDFLSRTDAAGQNPLFVRKHSSRVIDMLVAAGMPYADAYVIWEALRQGTTYDPTATAT